MPTLVTPVIHAKSQRIHALTVSFACSCLTGYTNSSKANTCSKGKLCLPLSHRLCNISTANTCTECKLCLLLPHTTDQRIHALKVIFACYCHTGYTYDCTTNRCTEGKLCLQVLPASFACKLCLLLSHRSYIR